MSVQNPEIHDLAKIDKLLDRIENEMKKKRTKNFFSSPEKYTNYMNKTTELYSLISEEVISFLDLLGLGEYMKTFQKLFRGLQQQIHSMLKFTLHYYNSKSLQVREAMITGKMPATASIETSIKPSIAFTVKIQKPHLPAQTTQSQTARDRTISSFAGTGTHILSPSDLPDQSRIELVRNSHSGPYYIKGEHTRNLSNLPRNAYLGSAATARSGFGSDMQSMEADDIYEAENYQHEYEKIQKEIHELLESKEYIMKIKPTTLALNLKQVLRSLENTKKNTKVMLEESDDEDEDIDNEEEFDLMIKKLMGACTQAQKKTFQKIINYIQNCRNQGQVVFRKDQATMPDPKMLDIDKKVMRREMEVLTQQKLQEINFLKKRVETVEQERNTAEDKYSKLLIEHSACEQEKKDTALQISALESEIVNLKEVISEGKRGRFSREPLTPVMDSPVFRPGQSNAQNVTEMNKRLMEQMSLYKSEIETLKLELKDERRSNMTSKVLDSGPMSELQSPARSPTKQLQALPSRTMGTPTVMKSTAKTKFVFEEKTGFKGFKQGKETKEENNEKETSITKTNSQAPSRKGSLMKHEGSLGLILSSPKEGHQSGMYPGESEFKKMRNNSPAVGLGRRHREVLEEGDLHEEGGTEIEDMANENHLVEQQQQEGDVSEKHTGKSGDKKVNSKGEVKSLSKIRRDNTAGKGSNTMKASPVSTLTKIPAGERGQSEEKVLPGTVKKSTGKGSEKTSPSKASARGQEKPSVGSIQEYGQVKRSGSKDELALGVDESKAKNIHVKKEPTKTQQSAKQGNGEKPKESVQASKDLLGDDDYLLKGNKDSRTARKEQTMPRHDLLNSSSRKNEECRREHHSVGVDKATQTEDLGPVAFRDNRRNLSISKEMYNKPYNLASPIFKGNNTAASSMQSDVRDSESRLASVGNKSQNKPKIGKNMMPSFDAKIKHLTSVGEDRSLMNEDSSARTKGRFQTDADFSAERIYEDWEPQSRRKYSKEDHNKVKRLTPRDKEIFMKVQMRSATSSSPVNHRESSVEQQEGDDSQINVMYKAMLAKAEQDPKILNVLKTYAKEKGEPVEEDGDFVPDYTLFAEYLQDLRQAHQKCGENCSHLQRFYSRIGYYHVWNNRAPLMMKKPDMTEEYGTKKKLPSRLPNIPEKKVLKMTS